MGRTAKNRVSLEVHLYSCRGRGDPNSRLLRRTIGRSCSVRSSQAILRETLVEWITLRHACPITGSLG